MCNVDTCDSGYCDVWSSPEHHGLQIFGSIHEPNMAYEFHLLVVWVDEYGRLFWAADSGCSCPSPFEDQSLDALAALNWDSLDEFWSAVRDFAVESWRDDENDWMGDLQADKTMLLSRVTSALAPMNVADTVASLTNMAHELSRKEGES